MKPMRHKMILQILQKENVETQEELAERLRNYGIDATQATISRDIKELKLQKILTESGRYRYQAPAKIFEPELDTRLRNIFRESVVSADRARNIIVMRTLPGLAPAACSAIDAMQLEEIVGTLAGDDTAIVIVRDDDLAVDFSDKIAELLR